VLVHLSQESVVAIVAVAGTVVTSIATTSISLRSSRRQQHDERLWARRMEAYEGYTAYQVEEMRSRHEQMTDAVEIGDRVDPDEAERLESIPMLNQIMMYGSDAVRDAVGDADFADRTWRKAYLAWQHQHPDSENPIQVQAAWRVADLAAERALETIRREVQSGRPQRLRLGRRATRELRSLLGLDRPT